MSNDPGRDDFGGLRCDFPGCKKVIRAFTGLQELHKLRQHMSRAHRNLMTMNAVLDHRADVEEGKNPSVERLARQEKYLTPDEREAAEQKVTDAIETHDAKRRRA